MNGYEKLDRIMQLTGTNACRVASEAGINRQVISAWKRGISVPKYETMEKIAEIFGVGPGYFYAGSNK